MGTVHSNVGAVITAGDGVELTFTTNEGQYLQLTIATDGASSGHTIAEAGTPVTARTTLNFGAGFDITDDAGNDETDVAIDLSELSVFTDHSARHEDGGADEISIAALAGIPTELQTHLDDTTSVHDHGSLGGLTDDDHTIYRKEVDPVHLVTFTKTGNLSTGTGATRWYNDTGATITLDSARGSVGTAPATTAILVDLNISGTSAWASTQANRITIAADGFTDEGGAFDDATVADGEYLTVDIDQVGTGTVGADLTVSIWGHYSL